MNVAEVPPDKTVTDGGTARFALFLEIAMEAPPAGAACDRVTVHVVEPGVATVVGEQVSPVS